MFRTVVHSDSLIINQTDKNLIILSSKTLFLSVIFAFTNRTMFLIPVIVEKIDELLLFLIFWLTPEGRYLKN